MKYNLDNMLPIRAFKPRSGSRFTSFGGGGMTLEGGGGGFLEDIVDVVSAPFEAVGEAVSDVAQTISDVGVQIDHSVNEALPGGWMTVGAVVATVATMGAASELLVADLAAEGALAAEIAADAAMAAETAGALEAGIEVATIGAETALEAGTSIAAAEGASTSIALEVGSTAAEMVGPGVELIGGYEAAASAAQQLALQEAAQAAGSGALKGMAGNALSSVVQGRDITPEGLMLAAATGGVGGGLGNLASNAAAEYGSLASKAAGALGGGLGGSLTGAALTGGNLGEAALTGGIAGLTGAAGAGVNAGLQELGVDPTGAGILSKTALGAGKAALTGGDALTGAFNSTVGAGMGMGLNAVGQGITDAGKDIYKEGTDYLKSLVPEQTPEAKLTELASSSATSDASPSPLEEAIGKLGASGTQDDQYTKQLLEALYPDVAVKGVEGALQAEKENLVAPQDLSNIDATGNIYDKSGSVVSSAVELGLVKGTDAQGNDVWITQNGDFIPTTTENQSTASTLSNQVLTPYTGSVPETSGVFGTGPSEAAADNPQEIINNPDGSVTILENDGTQRIFNTDGSVTFIDADGKSSEEFGPTPAATEAEKSLSSGSSGGSGGSTLGNLASKLLGPSLSSGTTTKSGSNKIGGDSTSWLPAAAAGAAALAAGASGGSSTQDFDPFNIGQYGFDWGSQGVNPANSGVVYGQNFFAPKFTKEAAEGGLMSIGNTVTPTVGQNGFRDPTASVQMYAKGGNIDHETMSIVKHLSSGGAPMHHIAGFLEYRNKKMARGGSLGSYSDGGRLLKGLGDGMSDDIPASIADVQPARLANEEFVIPADVVSHLGNGSSEAGAKVLYNMLDRVRKARTGHTKQGKQINPDKLMPKVRK
jgi:hypothetical protein